MIRILLADDQKDVRLGLKVLFENIDNMEVIGESAELTDLLNKVNDLKPDLVLLDWELANLNLAGLIPILRQLGAEMKIIALSSRPEALSRAMAAGADAFVSKGDYPEEIVKTINRIQKA